MTQTFHFDEDLSRRVEAIYVTPDIVAQRRSVLRALGLMPDHKVLDLGSGPGFLAAEMASQVGAGGRVCGIDASESMVGMARTRCADLPQVRLKTGDVRKLPYDEASFDASVSTQVYEYVEPMSEALAEAYRVLKPGGRLVILDTDWDSVVWQAGDAERMRRVLAVFEGHLADPHLPRRLGRLLGEAGFEIMRREVLPLFNPDFDENTYSHGMIDVIASFVAGRDEIGEDEAMAWAEDLRATGRRGDYFFSLNRYLFVATRPR